MVVYSEIYPNCWGVEKIRVDDVFSGYLEETLSKCGLKLVGTADWPERNGQPQGYVALYELVDKDGDKFYIFTNSDLVEEFVYVISDKLEEAIATAKEDFINWAKRHFDGEELERELEEIEETFKRLEEDIKERKVVAQ